MAQDRLGSRLLVMVTAGALVGAAGTARAQSGAAPAPSGPPVPAAAGTVAAGERGNRGDGSDRDASGGGEDAWTPGKLWSLGALAGLYTAVGVWAYFAWYHGKPRNPSWEWNGDGMFGVNTYAGGSDKLGHFWSTHALTRISAELLMSGGWRRTPASLIAGGLTALYFGMIEVKDAYYYEFSVGDLAADFAGAGLGILMLNQPGLDRLFDFRVSYWPTHEYMRGFEDGDVNFVEDYSGQTYFLALHLSGIPHLTDSPWTRWGRFLDLGIGYQSVNYKPEPIDPMAIPTQQLFLGVSINFQAILEELYGQPAERGRARTSHRVFHTIFEFVSPPFTTLRVAEANRSQDRM